MQQAQTNILSSASEHSSSLEDLCSDETFVLMSMTSLDVCEPAFPNSLSDPSTMMAPSRWLKAEALGTFTFNAAAFDATAFNNCPAAVLRAWFNVTPLVDAFVAVFVCSFFPAAGAWPLVDIEAHCLPGMLQV